MVGNSSCCPRPEILILLNEDLCSVLLSIFYQYLASPLPVTTGNLSLSCKRAKWKRASPKKGHSKSLKSILNQDTFLVSVYIFEICYLETN